MSIVENVLKHVHIPFSLREKQVWAIDTYGVFNRHGLYLDMGLGKTVCSTIIGIDRLLKKAFTCLVLCPPSIIPQWVRWLKSLGLETIQYSGNIEERKELIMLGFNSDFCVMSPNIFRNDFEVIRAVLKGKDIHLIIDEANIIKKVGVTHSKVRLLQGVEGGMSLLTGTPLTSPQDAYGYIKLLTPNIYTTKRQFDRVHIASKNEYNQAVEYDNLELLKQNFFLQAVRIEVNDMIEMPDIDYQFINYQLAPKHLELYRRLIKEKIMVIEETGGVIDATKAQSMRHWAQRLVFSPEHIGYKEQPAGVDLVLVEAEEAKRIIVFSTYVETNEKLCRLIPGAAGVYGSISRKQKDENIRKFQQGLIDKLAINPRSGGVGLELQDSCNHILFSEFPVTANEWRQARSRVWRQGQKKKVICRMLVAEGTIQASLIRNIMKKDDILAQVQPTKMTLRQELLGETYE